MAAKSLTVRLKSLSHRANYISAATIGIITRRQQFAAYNHYLCLFVVTGKCSSLGAELRLSKGKEEQHTVMSGVCPCDIGLKDSVPGNSLRQLSFGSLQMNRKCYGNMRSQASPKNSAGQKPTVLTC